MPYYRRGWNHEEGKPVIRDAGLPEAPPEERPTRSLQVYRCQQEGCSYVARTLAILDEHGERVHKVVEDTSPETLTWNVQD